MLQSRNIIQKIIEFIDDDEIIVLHGARQVGKTSINFYLIDQYLKKNINEKNIIYFDLEDFELTDLCNSGVPAVIDYLKGVNCDFSKKIYLFIDEIQYLTNPSSFLKLFHDKYKGKIKLFVTGSSSFAIKSKFKDSLVGRTVNFEIFPLDFTEFLQFKNIDINLKTTLPTVLSEKLKQLYREFVIYGGYPAIVLTNSIEKKEIKLKQIINTYVKKDIYDLADIRNIQKFNNLLRLLADQTGNLLNINELANALNLSNQTVEKYLFILENTYIIKIVSPFFRNIRSELRKMPKIFFEDTGMANIFINKTFPKVLSGNIFENSIYCELRKNVAVENLYFWRTNVGQEVDFVVDDKKIILIETKMKYSKKSLKNLFYLAEKYQVKNVNCVVLEKGQEETKENINILYPWEISKFTNIGAGS